MWGRIYVYQKVEQQTKAVRLETWMCRNASMLMRYLLPDDNGQAELALAI
jgi:hypothetical protein